MRALTILSEEHTPGLAEIPTLIEQGFLGITAFAGWGSLAPTSVPEPILDHLPSRLQRMCSQAIGSMPKRFTAFFAAEVRKRRKREEHWEKGELKWPSKHCPDTF